MEEADKVVQLDLERFGTLGFEAFGDTQTSETARIDETQFPARGQLRDQMSVLCHFAIRRANHHAPGHPKMDDPLRLCGAGALARRFFLLRTAKLVPTLGGRGRPPHTFQVEYDVLAYAAHACNALRLQVATIFAAGDFKGSGFEPSHTDSMTSPVTRLARPRAMVSTSGSSGIKAVYSRRSSVVSLGPADDYAHSTLLMGRPAGYHLRYTSAL